MGERRKTSRVSVAQPAVVVSPHGNAVGEVRNVSRDGMFIALASGGDVVRATVIVQLALAHPRAAVDLTGVVRRRDHRGIGVELTNLGECEAALIDALILASARPANS